MELPERYLQVQVKTKDSINIGFGFIDKTNGKFVSLSVLYLFSSLGIFEYNKNETKEGFRLFNPKDGFEYDLHKLLN